MDQLYIVTSVGDPSDYVDAALNQDGQVELDWFCHDRGQPIAHYDSLITDYTQIEEPEKGNAERYMDELFTRAEASLLIPYLCFTYGHLVGISVVPVPIDIFGNDASMANPVSMLLADGRWRIAHTVSPGEADYPLPFEVSAYYRVKDEG
ncbi:MAG TPA: hypothetical protein VFU22_04940 [Roseiflexaceae bacterium]|nr:hypothetical protein [Roseiflexaceae bacterium]